MTRVVSCVLFLLAISLAGCISSFWTPALKGSGIKAEVKRPVRGYDAIEIDGVGTLNVTIGDWKDIEISGDDNIVAIYRSRVEGSRLVLDCEKSIDTNCPLIINVQLPSLKHLEMSGATQAVATGLKEDSFNLEASGASSVSITGVTKGLTVDLSGACHADASDLAAEQVTVSLSGASHADVRASKTLAVDASGASHASYRGNPVVTSDMSGASSVSQVK